VKSASQLIVHTAIRHAFQGDHKNVPQFVVASAHVLINEKIQHAGMRKLRRLSEAAIAGIKHAQGRLDDGFDDLGRKLSATSGKGLGMRESILDHAGLLYHVAVLFTIRIRN